MSVLGVIRRRFGKIDRESFQLLYKSYVRLHMEYCVQAWTPYLVKVVLCVSTILVVDYLSTIFGLVE